MPSSAGCYVICQSPWCGGWVAAPATPPILNTGPGTPAFGRVFRGPRTIGGCIHTPFSLRRLGLLGVLALTACSLTWGGGRACGPFNVGGRCRLGRCVGRGRYGRRARGGGRRCGSSGSGDRDVRAWARRYRCGGGAHVGAGVGTSTVLHAPGPRSPPHRPPRRHLPRPRPRRRRCSGGVPHGTSVPNAACVGAARRSPAGLVLADDPVAATALGAVQAGIGQCQQLVAARALPAAWPQPHPC